MSSINKHLDPPISLTLGFRSPDLSTLNTLQSGSATTLRPLGFSVTGWLEGNAYSIVIPISNEDNEFSEVVTTQSSMRELELNVSLDVTPALRAAWVAAGSADPVRDGQTDVTEQERGAV